MSHIETASAQIREIDALASAVSRFAGARFNENCKQFMSYTGLNPCSHSITVAGVNYGIGVTPGKEAGTYDLAFDAYGTGAYGGHDGQKLVETFGPGLENLTNAYCAEYLHQQARSQGFTTTETVAENGDIVVTANSY